MSKWIRSEKYSAPRYPLYFHESYKYALGKEKYPRPHWALMRVVYINVENDSASYEYVEHFLSTVTFNEAKRWFDKYYPLYDLTKDVKL